MRVFLQMDRASSHPMSFTAVASALKEVTSAMEAGATPEAAEQQVQQKLQRGEALEGSASAPPATSKAAYCISIENEP